MTIKNTKWLEDLKSIYYSGVSSVFVLHGNYLDYVCPNIKLSSYLSLKFHEMSKDVVATYDFQSGLTFSIGSKQVYEEKLSATDDWNFMLQMLAFDSKNAAVIIRYPEFLFPNVPLNQMSEIQKNNFISFHKLITGTEFINSDNLVVFIADSVMDISEKLLNSNTLAIPLLIGYPNEEERIEMIEFFDSESSNDMVREVTKIQVAKMTAGLSRMQIEDIFLHSRTKGVLEKKTIIKRKNELLEKEYGDVIEVLDSEGYSFANFAGQQHVKDYHREVIIEPMLSGDKDLVPKGVLYVGPPGTGKTYFAKCLAGEANATAVIVRMEKIVDKWVGESEKRFAKLLMGLEALSPIIAFVDELDQAFHRGEGESNSVMKNLFSMYIQFLSEPSHRGNIVWVGASNYPNRIDSALKRPGRFDKKIPFLPPTQSERVALFKLYLELTKYPVSLNSNEFLELSKKTEGYTPAEIEGISIKVLELVKRKKLSSINYELVTFATSCITTTQNDKIKEMVEIALEECNDMEFLPPQYREGGE